MTDKLEDTSLRLKDEMDLYRKMMDKLWQNRHEFQKEREAMQEVRRRRLIAQLLKFWSSSNKHCPDRKPVFRMATPQWNRATEAYFH